MMPCFFKENEMPRTKSRQASYSLIYLKSALHKNVNAIPILGGKIFKLASLATLSQTTDCVAPVSGQHLTKIP